LSIGSLTHAWEIRNPVYRLGTTLLNPSQASAEQIIELYHERWEIELAHYALRHLMHEAACEQQIDPDRISFTRAGVVARAGHWGFRAF
jgi:hypothetical protein